MLLCFFILYIYYLQLLNVIYADNDNDNNFNIDINKNTGEFIIYINNKIWLKSGNIILHANNKKYISNNNLNIEKIIYNNGNDKIGEYKETSLLLKSNDNLIVEMECKYRKYNHAIVFEQYFPVTLYNTSVGDVDSIITSFPSFSTYNITDNNDINDIKGYSHWVSWHYETTTTYNNNKKKKKNRNLLIAPGFISPTVGIWDNMNSINNNNNNNNNKIAGGISGSGVTALFTRDGSVSTVLSPFSGFMAQSHILSGDLLCYGIMGNINEIPQYYSQSTIFYFNNNNNNNNNHNHINGLNNAMMNWGILMRKYYNVKDASYGRKRDKTLSDLGYSTDNGMYYYYHTDLNNTDNYENTLTNVYNLNVKKNKIPYQYILLDSWWYYRANNTDTGGGVMNWSSRPEIFPNGIEGLIKNTNWLVQAHNRYWSDESIYAYKNGGKFEFGIDNNTHGAVPLSSSFWEYLFNKPTKEWNLIVYEQDWLNEEFQKYYPEMMNNINLGKNWLLQMAIGAKYNNITIQYCMPNVRHLLQSLEVNQLYSYENSNIITQARASDDHKPSEDLDQWRIGGQSMLIDALGLSPSKDGFWSTTYQPNNPYGEDKIEQYPSMQSMVSTLSAGPVQIGDGIGYTDKKVIMKSCRLDGKLLHPDIPAMPIDSSIYQLTFNNYTNITIGPNGDIWYTYTNINNYITFYITAIILNSNWILTLKELQHIILSRSININTDNIQNLNEKYWIIDHFQPDNIQIISNISSFEFKSCLPDKFQLYSIIPMITNKWSVIGELNKWISTSSSRFLSILTSINDAIVIIKLIANETITIGFISPNGQLIKTTCISNSNDNNILQITSNGNCIIL